jgi:hypothetical protein
MFQCFFEGYQALELNLDYHCHWQWEFGIIGSFKGESLKALKSLYERAKKFHMKPIKKFVGTWQILELSIKSPCLHPLFHPPIPSLCGIHKVMKFLLNLSIKCWKSAFNAQGLRLSVVTVKVGVVKIYVAAVEALRKKERQDKTQFTAKIGRKTRLGPNYFVLSNFHSQFHDRCPIMLVY